VYQAVFGGVDAGIDGGIMITASHNPAAYNGMKIVQRESRPVSSDSGLLEIEQLAADDNWFARKTAQPTANEGAYSLASNKNEYIDHIFSMVDCSVMQPMKIVVNAGNGCAGPVLDLLAAHLPFEFIRLHHEPDGTFPNGVPNPLLPEKREVTAQAVRAHKADLGIAWDGDFDRCFFYDEQGRFIEGYYIVGLLAVSMLQQAPGSTILHDPRLTWNTIEMVKAAGGVPVMTRTGVL